MVLPKNVKTLLQNKTQLSLPNKRQNKKDHQHDLVYYEKSSKKQCTENYTGEKGKHLTEGVKDCSSKDAKFCLFEHEVETKHKMVSSDVLKVIIEGYKKSKF